MTQPQVKGQLIVGVETAVTETLAYFETEGQRSQGRVGDWGAWETLAHFAYWHYATAWGIRSASTGGPPWLVSASADQINDVCLAMLRGEPFSQLLTDLRVAQDRLLAATRDAHDLSLPAFRMPDGRQVSIGERLATIARHWRGHVEALKATG
jgi:hypothetical protein